MRRTVTRVKTRTASVRLSCRVSPITKSRAEQAALVLGKTISRFVEEAIALRAEEVLARHERIVLSERDFAAFMKAINSPAEPPTPGLLAEVAAYNARHAKKNLPSDEL